MKKLNILLIVLFTIFISFNGFSTGLHLTLQKEIDAVSDGYVLVPSIDKIKIFDGKIYALSIKESKFYAFDLDGKFLGKIMNRGEGPCELRYAYNFFPLSNGKILFLNGADEFYIVKMDKGGCKSIDKIEHPIHFPSEVRFLGNDMVLVLKNIPPVLMERKRSVYLLYIFNLDTQKIVSEFFPFTIKNPDRLKFVRGEMGGGSVEIKGDKIYVVYNQPGFLKIFSKKGKLLEKLDTKFPFLKENTARIERVERNGVLLTRINSNKLTTMKLIKFKGSIYLLVGSKSEEDGKVNFYLGKIGDKKIVLNKIDFSNTDDEILYFNSCHGGKFIFSNDDSLFIFKCK